MPRSIFTLPIKTISAKLLLTNLVVFASIGGVLAVMFFSFQKIEQRMMTIVHVRVPQMNTNARIGTIQGEVFARTSHVIDRFLEERDLLEQEGDILIQKLQRLVTQSATTPELQSALIEFRDVLQTLLTTAARLSESYAQLQQYDQDVDLQVNLLEDYLTNAIILTGMQDGDVRTFEQISRLVPWYRQTRLRTSLLLATVIRKYLRLAPPEAQEDGERTLLDIFVILDTFDARLQLLGDGDTEMKKIGNHVLDIVRAYKVEVRTFSQDLAALQVSLQKMDANRAAIIGYLGAMDRQITRTTETMQTDSVRLLRSSRILSIGLTSVIVIVMMVGWLSMRWMIRPLPHLSQIAEHLAEGAIDCSLETLPRVTADDEIGVLSRAMIKLLAYMQEMATTAAEIAQGNVAHTLIPRSAHDVLGQACSKMSRYLNELAEAATAIAAGKLQSPIQPKTDRDVLGNAFYRMARQLDENFQELQKHREHLEDLVNARTIELTQEIADRKRAEAELERAKEAALSALQAAEAASQAKSEFLAHMSHDLRTPLNGVLGYTQILQRDPTLTAQQREAVESIERSGRHLLLMIGNILDLSRIEAGKRELVCTDFYLPDVVRIVAEIGRIQTAQKGITFQVDYPVELHHTVYGDQTSLNQVLLNLVHNAIKFTVRGSVTLRVIPIDPPSAFSSERKLRFQIQDTGIGIPPEELARIFEPFQQVPNPLIYSQGLGLGLAICRRLVRMMGTEIQVQSAIGEGSTFWFDLALPYGKAMKSHSATSSRTIIGFKGPACKVLVVDDTPENVILLKDMLQPLGFAIETAANGRDALEQAAAFRPDVILMDLLMPEMDGFETTRQIRQSPALQKVVVIAVSANAFEQTRQKSVMAGCDDFLAKPVDLKRLLECLHTHAGTEWRYNDELGIATRSTDQAEAAIILPPSDAGRHLRDLVQKGDLMAVCTYVDRLEQTDAQYASFAARVRELALACYIDELEVFLEDCYMNG